MKKPLLSRIAAVFLLSIPIGWLVWSDTQNKLQMMETDASGFVSLMKVAYSNSVVIVIIVHFLLITAVVLCVEAVSFLIRRGLKSTSK